MTEQPALQRCVFFDRDGIVNISPPEGDYVRSWANFRLSPDLPDILRIVRDRGCAAVVITNQRGVAMGLMSVAAVEEIHARLQELLRACGVPFLDILYCPHDKGACACRKPQPGMLLEAARRHHLDLARSWMVGDRAGDMEAGHRAGCRTILVSAKDIAVQADYRVQTLGELKARLGPWLDES